MSEGPAAAARFDATKYLVNLGGKGDYLEVKWRLLWLRTEQPDAVVETELVKLEDREAVFKAVITLPSGGRATGYGSETAGDFRDFVEKAETKAIGRALAALGYGTQFCTDHEFGADSRSNDPYDRVVDAPVRSSGVVPPKGHAFKPGPGTVRTPAPYADGRPNPPRPAAGATEQITERQLKFVWAIGREGGLEEQEVRDWVAELFNGAEVEQLNRRDASNLIEALQRRRNEIA